MDRVSQSIPLRCSEYFVDDGGFIITSWFHTAAEFTTVEFLAVSFPCSAPSLTRAQMSPKSTVPQRLLSENEHLVEHQSSVVEGIPDEEAPKDFLLHYHHRSVHSVV